MAFTNMTTDTMTGTGRSTLRLVVSAVLLWGVAAVGAHLAQGTFDDHFAVFAVRLTAIVVCGALLGLTGTPGTGGRAIVIGIAWATLAIATEIFFTGNGAAGWFELLGSPAGGPDWMRAATLLAWLVAPSVAARDVESGNDRSTAARARREQC